MTIANMIAKSSIDLERRSRITALLQAARCLIVGGPDHFEVMSAAKTARVVPAVLEGIEALRTKASVAAASTTDATWASPLANTQLVDAFAETLRDASAFDRLLPDMLRVPPQTKVVAITAGISGAAVDEGAPKPAGRLSASNFDVVMKKSVAFIVITKELMRASSVGALAMLNRELSGAVATVTDTTFIADLTASISTIPSSGATALAVRADMRAALDAVDTGAASRLYWLASSSIAKRLAVIGDASGAPAFPETASGNLGAWPLVISDGVGSGLLILCDAAQIAASALPIELDATDQATIQMDSAPDSPVSGSTNVVPLWSMNQSALRATRYFAVKRLRDTAVAIVSNVTGIGNSPS